MRANVRTLFPVVEQSLALPRDTKLWSDVTPMIEVLVGNIGKNKSANRHGVAMFKVRIQPKLRKEYVDRTFPPST